MTIWKFPVEVTDNVVLMMPCGAQILSVQVQQGQVCVWAMVDPKASPAPKKFRIYGTGHTVAETDAAKLRFVGTFQLSGGILVFHLFEVM